VSITLGIYDVFSYAIPGILYLFTFNETLKLLGLPFIDILQLENGFHAILLGMLSYLIGHLFDYISHYIWYRRFYPGHSEQRAYSTFTTHTGVTPEFDPRQWPVLMAVLRHNDMEICYVIDKNKATSIMFRNVSFALFLLTLVFAVSTFVPNFSLVFLLGAAGAAIGSFVSLRRGDVFNQWFYMLIYQQSLVYGSNLKEVLDNHRPQPTKDEQPMIRPEENN